MHKICNYLYNKPIFENRRFYFEGREFEVSYMLKKILKYTFRTLLVILLVLVLLPALLYIPGVQNFVRARAVGYASQALGMEMSVERLRLCFPFRLSLENTLLVDDADTLVNCRRLSLDVALWPLIRKEVVVRSFELEKVAARYKDSTAGMEMRIAAGVFSLSSARADLSAKTIAIYRVALCDGDVRLDMTQTAPAQKADSSAALPWQIDVEKLTIGNLAFAMHTAPAVSELTVRLPDGAVERCRVQLGNRQVSVGSISLDRGQYAYLTTPPAPDKEMQDKSATPDSDTTALPWTIRVGSIALADNSLEYGRRDHRPSEGFDPSFIGLSSLELDVDSIYNRGTDIALQIRRMSFAERSGLSVRDAGGRFGMDADGISLSAFHIETAYSRFRADLTAGAGALRGEADAPLSADLSASVNTKDVKYLFPALITPPLDNRIVRMDLRAAGTLNDIGKAALDISSPGHVTFTLEGRAKNTLAPDKLAASARFGGEFVDMDFLKALLPDSALRRRIAIPKSIGLHGTIDADRGKYALTLALDVGEGRLSLDGKLDPGREYYAAELRCDSFPMNRFLPADSLGAVDLTLQARGAGFNPLLKATRSSVRAEIARAEYRGRDFGGVAFDAQLENQHLTGRLSDRDEALRLSLLVNGTLTQELQEVCLRGDIFDFDLQALGATQEKIGGSFTLDACASASDTGAYAARIALDSIEIRNGYRTDRIRPVRVAFGTDRAATGASLKSGDLSLSFRAPEPMDSLVRALGRSADVLTEQIRSQAVDMESLKSALPGFGLQVSAGRENILNDFLKTRKIAFKALHVEGVNCDTLPLSVDMRVEGLQSGNILLDTLTAGIAQHERQLRYFLRAANAPANPDHAALASLCGHIVGNTARVNLCQKNREGRTGFRFGLDILWSDSLVKASMTPPDPIFGYEPWQVNPGNYLVYRFGKSMAADLDLVHGDQRFALHTVSGGDSPDGIRLDIGGLNIGSILSLLPSAPPVEGVLNADVTLNMATDSMAVQGNVSVAELFYDKQRFGDVGLGVHYEKGRDQKADARLTLDEAEVLTVRGDYRAGRESPVDLTVAIPGFPLQRANVFLPADLLHLSGTLRSNLRIGGTFDRPKLDGGVQFAQTDVRVPMIGTSFGLSSDTIRVADSRILFDSYAIFAPNKKPLTIAGEINLADTRKMTADIKLQASDFQVVNVARKEGKAVYGKAYLDLNATARGPLDQLVVRGSVALLGGTDINYVMQDSPMDVKERPQNVVTFVSFRDMDSQDFTLTPQTVRIGGMDVLLNVDINNDVSAAVDLSADGSNRIDLQGGGNLTYSINPLGDSRLSGKYVLSGGTVRYNPPVIPQKIFKITQGSYVEWIGDIADPAFNITAIETVRANVSTDGQDSRSVNFDISINIRNTLNDLSVSFGLSAPQDLTLQNQLNSLTAEQRANQAINLLIYNTYTGPGTTAKVNTGNPLNSFIQKELNQWAQNSLRGVDLSFGIDSYGEDDPSGQRTDYSYRLSKNLFSNRVRAVIGGKISTDSDPSQNLKENLIDDISLEYMLNKRDNIFIRLFRHTGYESILEGEITETGVGFVIRKKLLRLGDLFRSTKRIEKKLNQNEAGTN